MFMPWQVEDAEVELLRYLAAEIVSGTLNLQA